MLFGAACEKIHAQILKALSRTSQLVSGPDWLKAPRIPERSASLDTSNSKPPFISSSFLFVSQTSPHLLLFANVLNAVPFLERLSQPPHPKRPVYPLSKLRLLVPTV